MNHYDTFSKQRSAVHDTAMGSTSLKPQSCLRTTNVGLATASNYYFSLVVCVRVRSCLCACGGVRACLCARPRVCAYVCVWAFVSGCACAPLCTWGCACIKFASNGVARLFHYPRLAGSPKRRASLPRLLVLSSFHALCNQFVIQSSGV